MSEECPYCEKPEYFGLSIRKRCKTGWRWKTHYSDALWHPPHSIWGHEDAWGCVIICKRQGSQWLKKK